MPFWGVVAVALTWVGASGATDGPDAVGLGAGSNGPIPPSQAADADSVRNNSSQHTFLAVALSSNLFLLLVIVLMITWRIIGG